ncbi:hypothetical protein Ddc_17510 [Ditylenchus destructor]|nr:hypothetical protein Ddc_17510 [Ditylenchus destructor]
MSYHPTAPYGYPPQQPQYYAPPGQAYYPPPQQTHIHTQPCAPPPYPEIVKINVKEVKKNKGRHGPTSFYNEREPLYGYKHT